MRRWTWRSRTRAPSPPASSMPSLPPGYDPPVVAPGETSLLTTYWSESFAAASLVVSSASQECSALRTLLRSLNEGLSLSLFLSLALSFSLSLSLSLSLDNPRSPPYSCQRRRSRLGKQAIPHCVPLHVLRGKPPRGTQLPPRGAQRYDPRGKHICVPRRARIPYRFSPSLSLYIYIYIYIK